MKEIHLPGVFGDVTQQSADLMAAAVRALNGEAIIDLSDAEYRKLVDRFATIVGVERRMLSDVLAASRRHQYFAGGLAVHFGRGPVGRFPAKHPTENYNAGLDQLMTAMRDAKSGDPDAKFV